MRTYTFTQAELRELQAALAVHNDIMSDTLFDDVSELHPTADQPQTLTIDSARGVRKQLSDALNRLIVVHNVMRKLGLETNELGYSHGPPSVIELAKS